LEHPNEAADKGNDQPGAAALGAFLREAARESGDNGLMEVADRAA
jgi:hypothetical protein